MELPIVEATARQEGPPAVGAAGVDAAYARLRAAARRDRIPSLDERRDRLARLERMLLDRRHELAAAVDADFGGRSRHETLLADVLLTLDGIREARRSLPRWMAGRAALPNPWFLPARARVEWLPKGVVAVIAPWNYPVNLALAPVAAALAAGNRVLLKPSELTPRTSALLGSAARESFSAEELAVVEGGPEVAQAVARLPLDHLFFTGSTAVGRLVAQEAARSLVPVTLELGGKSPALLLPDADLELAAQRIALGKGFNAGQTCIAPDYALVPEGRERDFAAAFRRAVERAWPRLAESPDWSAIVSSRHRRRLQGLLDDAAAGGALLEVIAPGGAPDPASRRMAPVLAFGVRDGMKLMQEEIFGPILPVLAYRSLDEAIAGIAARPRPLAFYCFGRDRRAAAEVLSQVRSGGACVNDTLVHFAQERLPFGGLGQSGQGAYHGRWGFETFSHPRGVVEGKDSPARRLLAPPYGRLLDASLEVLLRGVRSVLRG